MSDPPYVVSGGDRAAFLRCRREWDHGARERGNLEPARPVRVVDPQRALRDALAVYYFPGMWDWSPAIVRPLVVKAFTDSVERQRREYLGAHGLGTVPRSLEASMDADVGLALRTLDGYQAWAPEVDEFAPVRVLAEFDVRVPHRHDPDRALVAGARAVHFRDRIDVLVIDEAHAYWVLEHRLVTGWADPDVLRLDDRPLAWLWGWEQENPGMVVTGTIYNELRVGRPEPAVPPRGPRGTVAQNSPGPAPPRATGGRPEFDLRVQHAEDFRRVYVPRGRAEVHGFGERLADELLDMVDPDVRIYPHPEPTHCARCPFRAPCVAIETDADPVPADTYRQRDHEPRPGTLGARTWTLGRGAAPPSFGGA